MLKHRTRAERHHRRSLQHQDQAADDLRFIRDAMERSSRFTDVPGRGMVLIGLTAIAAALIAQLQTGTTAWATVWGVEFVLAVCLGVLAVYLKARTNRSHLLAEPVRKFVLGMLPGLVAGAMLTLFLLHHGVAYGLPGAWLVLYGTAVISGGAHAVRLVPLQGICFVALGGLALLFSPDLGDLFMALGFGGVHIAFGLVIARQYGG